MILFKTDYAQLLDCSFEKAIKLAEDASRRGWIIFKRVGDIIEVLFPNLINKDEMEWIREQSYENNNYRLLDGYDGWNYLAVPITADKEF